MLLVVLLRENPTSAWQMDPVHPMWTQIDLGMLLDPKNKHMEECLIFLKIQDGSLLSKVKKIDQN